VSFSETDPYDMAAWSTLQICCDSCGTMLDLADDPDDSDACWHEYGQRAKKGGWIIREVGSLKDEWTMLCPTCARTQHATPTI
jgi:hypothetical protein